MSSSCQACNDLLCTVGADHSVTATAKVGSVMNSPLKDVLMERHLQQLLQFGIAWVVDRKALDSVQVLSG